MIVIIVGLISYILYTELSTDDRTTSKQNTADQQVAGSTILPTYVKANEYWNKEETEQANSENYKGELLNDTLDTIPYLKNALDKIAKKDPCFDSQGVGKITVLAVTKDKTQALYSKTCGGEAGANRYFMIKNNDKWEQVTSNKDDKLSTDAPDFSPLLDLPNCELVNKYSIQKSIAPFCMNVKDGKSDLAVGDTRNYSYSVR